MRKTILITGSNSGIGKRTAWLFAQKGWKVLATMRNLDNANELKDLPNIHIYRLDVTNTWNIEQTRDEILSVHKNVDVVINNAGFGVYGPFELATEEQIDLQYDVNVKGVMRVTKAFLPHFREKKKGLFLNVSSIAGLISYPLGALYNSSKWALEGLSEALWYEFRPLGIRVKLVEPGAFRTNFQERGLIWTEDESITDYDAMSKLIRDRRKENQDKLPDPSKVADSILSAVQDKSLRLRYIVGKDARAFHKRRRNVGSQAFMEDLYNEFELTTVESV